MIFVNIVVGLHAPKFAQDHSVQKAEESDEHVFEVFDRGGNGVGVAAECKCCRR